MTQSADNTQVGSDVEAPLILADEDTRVTTGMFAGLPIRTAKASVMDMGLCALIYGQPGSGKTTLGATLADSPHAGRVCFLDVEGGIRSISDRDDIDVLEIHSWSEMQMVGQKIIAMGNDLPWGSFVVDNLCEIQDLNLQHHAGGGEITLPMYGKSTMDLIRLVRFFRDLSRNRGLTVIINAWEETEKDEMTSTMRRGLGVTPKLALKLPGVVDIVGYLAIENNPPNYTRVLHFESNPRMVSKFRRGKSDPVIPLTIPNPDFASILAVLKGGEKWPEAKHVMPGRAAAPVATQVS